jgi:hypothetical protein
VSAKHKRKGAARAARPAEPGLGFVVEQQPDDVTCGPACLHGVYRYYDDEVPLEQLVADIHMLDKGGTLDVFLANHALKRGYDATILTYNLDLFDPTWFGLPNEELRARLASQAKVKPWRRLQTATRGYDEFLRLGGKLELRDLAPALLRKYLDRGPLITGLSATYLYRAIRDVPDTNADDDVRGEPVGHFVVLTGYRRETKEILIADPLKANPLVESRYYAVQVQRLIGAILLGVMTYDANLLVIKPKHARR